MADTMMITKSGYVTFDAILKTEHSASVTLTQHPVQIGAQISDHAIVEPEEITLEVGVSDASRGDGYCVTFFQTMMGVLHQREPVTLGTRLMTYPDMVLVSISAPDDYTTMHALKLTMMFQRVRVVSVSGVTVQGSVTGSKTAVAAKGNLEGKHGDTSGANTSASRKTEKPVSQTENVSVAKDLWNRLTGGGNSAQKKAEADTKSGVATHTSKTTTPASGITKGIIDSYTVVRNLTV